MITRDQVLQMLSKVRGPDRHSDIVSLNLVDGISLQDNNVFLSIKVAADQAQALEPMRQAAEKAVSRIPGIGTVTAIFTAEINEPKTSPSPKPTETAKQAVAGVPGITHLVAVASGKGGVGKSTTSVNLALSLLALGKKVGLLDADIYGPSIPRMLGITGTPAAKGSILSPLNGYGLKVMSMGFLVEEDTPMIWRGPMVMQAVTQMLHQVDWGQLDILIIDMPPGTGDVQLTMAQQVPLSGSVIVSTPQDIALLDARKGLNMFRKVDIPVLGMIENMSLFICPKCGRASEIFGCGGAKDEADRLGIPFLGAIPLHMDIRRNSDAGTPEVITSPTGPHAKAYATIAADIIARLQTEQEMGTARAPQMIVE